LLKCSITFGYGPLGLLLEDRNRKFDFDPLSLVLHPSA
jgi:hypothetical protein